MKLTINQDLYSVDNKDANRKLLWFLRDDLGLIGTRFGCGAGICGACTVTVNGKAITSCLTLAVQLEGDIITTVEGLGSDGRLHPLQESFMRHGAVQCGYCTPGFLMAAKALLDENPNPSRQEIVDELRGNLCRCTGYQKIIDAVADAANLLQRSQ